jgi:eukaryotic-like serine/threonine-protein kinase
MTQQILPEGTIIGGRFTVEQMVGQGDLGRVYRARDTKNNNLIALRAIGREEIADESDVDRMRLRVKEASALTHRNVRTTFGMGVEESGLIYISVEWIEGRNLATLLAARNEAGKRFSFKGAYNIIGHVCNALAYAHQKTFHGALSPRAIMVSSSGRVKVSDWGLSTIRTRLASYPGRQKDESAFWAPEVISKPAAATARSDIYSVGALFYQLITGAPPRRPLRAPSTLGFSKDVDAVIARCMAADPMQRYENAEAAKEAFSTLVKKLETPSSQAVPGSVDDDLGIDVEIDLAGIGVPEPGAKFKQPVPTFSASPTAPKPPPPKGPMLAAPGLPAPPSADLGTDGDVLMGGRASVIDMGAVMSSIGKSEAARWMVQKDKFDHGQFTDRELIQMIMLGEVQAKHNLLNMDTGVRKKLKTWPEFEDVLEKYRIKKKQEEEAAALRKTESAEKRGTAFKLMIAACVVGGLGLVVGGYFLTRSWREEKKFNRDEMISKLDSGEIKLKLGSDPTGAGGRRGGRRHGGGKGGGGGGGNGEFVPGMSYEEAMAAGVDLGSLTNNNGQKQLTAEDIQNTMDRNVRRFLSCMDGSTKRVDLEIAVGSNGRVDGVSAKQGSSGLKRCCEGIVRSIKFPPSASPRTATSWWFEVDY